MHLYRLSVFTGEESKAVGVSPRCLLGFFCYIFLVVEGV